MIRVLLVDDQPLVREGLRAVIGRDPDLAIAGEAENGRDALCRLREVPADVVLMDIRMPVMDGIEATRRITSDDDLGHVRVVALTTFDTDDFLFQSLRAGASGFLLKDSDPQQVRQAIKVAAAGDALLSPGVTRRVIEAAAASSRPDPAPLSYLTEREQEVLAGVGGRARQRRHRPTALHQPGHRPHTRRAHPQQARRPRPRPARRDRVEGGDRPPPSASRRPPQGGPR